MALHGLQLPHSKPAMEPAANPQPPVPQKLPPQPTVVMRADLEAQQRVMRADGQLELIETADGLHVDDLRAFAAQQGYVAVYLPDHASKSRFIIPGIKLWSEDQALWVSGGDLSITPLPFMLKAVPTPAWLSASP